MADLTVAGQLLGSGILGAFSLVDMVLAANREEWNQKRPVPLEPAEEAAARKGFAELMYRVQ
jgi:hypothetical protein